MIEIYSQDGCRPCVQSKAWMSKNGIEFVTKDVADPSVFAELQALGFSSVPVLKHGDDMWTGFNPLKLRELVA